MTVTNQANFSAMAGHVEVGTVVHMDNGDTLTLCNRIQGWIFTDQKNRDVQVPTNSAHVLECIVYRYPGDII